MIHKYRSMTEIAAEQFDGSNEMIKKYDLVTYGPDTYRFSWDYNFIPIVEGDFIITDKDGFHNSLSPDEFSDTYERCD